MATTSEGKLYRSLPGWQHYGNRIEKTFNFDDFSAAARFVGRMADDAAGVSGSAGDRDRRPGDVAVRRPRPRDDDGVDARRRDLARRELALLASHAACDPRRHPVPLSMDHKRPPAARATPSTRAAPPASPRVV